MSRREYDDDDGRTIADMNVEGMPWYRKPERNTLNGKAADQITREESRAALWGALKAALLVIAVLSAGAVLFILFCTTVWFR